VKRLGAISTIAVAAFSVTVAWTRVAGAAGQWIPLGAGCASAISVGANNVPWIIGCEPNSGAYIPEHQRGPDSLYYLTWTGDSLIRTPRWVDANFHNAMWLSVNVQGFPFVTDTSGTLYGISTVPDGNGDDVPSGTWFDYGPGAGAIAAGVEATPAQGSHPGVLFYPDVLHCDDIYGYMWGIGCSGDCGMRHFDDDSIWKAEFTIGNGGYSIGSWSRMNGGVAQQPAVFSDLGTSADGTDTYQNVWILTAEEEVWYWDGNGTWTNAKPPEPIMAITDHNVLGVSGQVYAWTDGNGHPGPSRGFPGGKWVAIGPKYPALAAIAYSSAVTAAFENESGVIGPSELWALDTEGNVYTLSSAGGVIQ